MDKPDVWMAECKYCGARYRQTIDHYSTAYCSMECTKLAIVTANPDLVNRFGPHKQYENVEDEPRGCYCGRTSGNAKICKNPRCKEVKNLVETGWKSEPLLVRINRDGVTRGKVDLTDKELDELVPVVTHFFLNYTILSNETVWSTQRVSTLDVVEGAAPDFANAPKPLRSRQ